MARDLPARAAAAWARACRRLVAAPSTMDCRAAHASRRTSPGPPAAAPCAYWRTTPQARRRTSRRTARPAHRNWQAQRDRRWRPPARNRRQVLRRALPRPLQHRLGTSTPSTWPDGATSRANAIDVAPLPQPTSMTRSPGFSFARSITRSATGLSSDILRRLPIRPALPGRPVPVGDLVGVSIVGMRDIHMPHSSTQRRGTERRQFRAHWAPHHDLSAPALRLKMPQHRRALDVRPGADLANAGAAFRSATSPSGAADSGAKREAPAPVTWKALSSGSGLRLMPDD